ncbi:retrovirus-related pol polyprotein from transposon TNT 1-94 [Tanacetum coccineum]
MLIHISNLPNHTHGPGLMAVTTPTAFIPANQSYPFFALLVLQLGSSLSELVSGTFTPVQEQGETSSRHVDSSNMHTFYQHHPSAQRWTKDHPLEQVIGNPSQSVRTRRQLETDGEMCMFALTGIKREFSVARTPQQKGVAERKNRTLIEAARTMVLVIKPHNKIPYELIRGRPPLIDFMKPFGCPVTILNTKDHLGKFDGKANEGYFVRYSVVSKAMRVFNKKDQDWNKTKGVAGTQRKHCLVVQAQKEKEPEARGDRLEMKATEVDDNEGLHDIKVGRHDQEVKKWHQKCIVGPSFDIVVPSTTI